MDTQIVIVVDLEVEHVPENEVGWVSPRGPIERAVRNALAPYRFVTVERVDVGFHGPSF